MIVLMALAIFLAGCGGGLITSVIAGEMKLPAVDRDEGVFSPGWVGLVVVGGVAAFVSWGLYGPLSESALLGASSQATDSFSLSIAEVCGSILVGIGGGRWLKSESDRAIMEKSDVVQRAQITSLNQTVKNLKEGSG